MGSRIDVIAEKFYPLRGEYAKQKDSEPTEFEKLTPPEKKFISSLDDFKLVGNGAARCILTPTNKNNNEESIVYKIARLADSDTIYDGIEQNEYEAFLSSAVQDEFAANERPKLLPVLDSSDENYWVKMPLVPILFDAQTNSDKRKEIRDNVLDSLGPIRDNVMLAEVNSGNIGKYNGEWHLVDYGGDPLVAGSL